jgi:hypothetical protein
VFDPDERQGYLDAGVRAIQAHLYPDPETNRAALQPVRFIPQALSMADAVAAARKHYEEGLQYLAKMQSGSSYQHRTEYAAEASAEFAAGQLVLAIAAAEQQLGDPDAKQNGR